MWRRMWDRESTSTLSWLHKKKIHLCQPFINNLSCSKTTYVYVQITAPSFDRSNYEGSKRESQVTFSQGHKVHKGRKLSQQNILDFSTPDHELPQVSDHKSTLFFKSMPIHCFLILIVYYCDHDNKGLFCSHSLTL